LLPGQNWGSKATLALAPSHTRCSTDCQRQSAMATRGPVLAPRRRWPSDLQSDAHVPRPASMHDQGYPLGPPAAGAQLGGRRQPSVAAHGAGGHRPSHGHVLGYTSHSHASTHTDHSTLARCSRLVSRGAAQSVAAAHGPLHKVSRHDGRLTDKHDNTTGQG
jgi:hypothetical protein